MLNPKEACHSTMRMTFESPERLRIELDPADMSDLNVTVEELDYGSGKTRRILNELLARVGAQELLTSDTGRRLIEVFPADNGGCVIYFTALRKGNASRPRRSRGLPAVWELQDADSLLAAAAALQDLGPQGPVRLYQMEKGYRLVLPLQSRQQELLLSEFALPVLNSAASSWTAEHGRLLTARLLSVIPKPTRRPPDAIR